MEPLFKSLCVCARVHVGGWVGVWMKLGNEKKKKIFQMYFNFFCCEASSISLSVRFMSREQLL